jgi:hypothetical protein
MGVCPSAATLPELQNIFKTSSFSFGSKSFFIFANALKFSIFGFGVVINEGVT